MKFQWEVTDIKPEDAAGCSFLGSIIENTKTTACNRFSILGYRYVPGVRPHQEITLTSLDDGLMIASLPVEAMVELLNDVYAPVLDSCRIKIKR